jgi:predicted nucleic acid-binding protein
VSVLVDSSIWIQFFAGNPETDPLDELLEQDLVLINDAIRAEIVPFLLAKEETEAKELLEAVRRTDLIIDWEELIRFQTTNAKHGLTRVGIPDLIILQQALQHDLQIYSLDKHFERLAELHGCRLYSSI